MRSPGGGGRKRGLDRKLHASGQGDMVVLEENSVVEPGSMVGGSAHRRCVFVQGAPAGKRLPGVDDARSGAFYQFHEAPRPGGDPAQACEEVQRGSLPRENGPHPTGHDREGLSGSGPSPIPGTGFETQIRIDGVKHRGGDVQAAHHEALA